MTTVLAKRIGIATETAIRMTAEAATVGIVTAGMTVMTAGVAGASPAGVERMTGVGIGVSTILDIFHPPFKLILVLL